MAAADDTAHAAADASATATATATATMGAVSYDGLWKGL